MWRHVSLAIILAALFAVAAFTAASWAQISPLQAYLSESGLLRSAARPLPPSELDWAGLDADVERGTTSGAVSTTAPTTAAKAVEEATAAGATSGSGKSQGDSALRWPTGPKYIARANRSDDAIRRTVRGANEINTNGVAPLGDGDARMNILFVVADDMRPEGAVYGTSTVAPHLSALAKRGVAFDRAYCQVSVCCPSRNSFMHGRRPDVLQSWYFEVWGEPSWTTLPRAFSASGYTTLGFGKVFHGPEGPAGDLVEWPDNLAVSGSRYIYHSGGHGLRDCQDFLVSCNATVTAWAEDEIPLAPGYQFVDVEVADHAVDALRVLAERRALAEQDANSSTLSSRELLVKPWFLAVGFKNPHLPFVFPQAFWDLYDGDEALPLPPQPVAPKASPPYAVGDQHSGFIFRFTGAYADSIYCANDAYPAACSAKAISEQHKMTFGVKPPQVDPIPRAVQQELMRGYAASVSFMDAQLGKVMAGLAHYGHEERTVVVFTSDHGFSVGDFNQFGKGSLFEVENRVPLIVADPRRTATHGLRTRALVELVDIFPTLVDLAGIPQATLSITGPPLGGGSFARALDGDLSRGFRAAALSQFRKCILLGSPGDMNRAAAMRGQSKVCGNTRGWEWCTRASTLVLMGYSLRSPAWRYTAWVLWDCDTTSPLWRYPPWGEELYDHSMDTGVNGFNRFEGANMAVDPASAGLRWDFFCALKALVEGDQAFGLKGGLDIGLAGLAEHGRSSWGSGAAHLTPGSAAVAAHTLPAGAPALPAWVRLKLDEAGLWPPLHSEIVEVTSSLHANQTAAAASFESAELTWPKLLSRHDRAMLLFEPLMRPGDVVDVRRSSGKGGWTRRCVVKASTPRITLRDETGAALELNVASNVSTLNASQVSIVLESLIYIPSRIWPEGDDPRGWIWRPQSPRDIPARMQRRVFVSGSMQHEVRDALAAFASMT